MYVDSALLWIVIDRYPSMPTRASWDSFMSGYIEQCWLEGEPLGRATYALCGLEWTHPPLKGTLKGSWQLIRTWEKKEEPPARATPFSAEIVVALASLAIASSAADLAALLLAGFDGLLRTGELFYHYCRTYTF